ncbi:MAG TPA: MFS transporter [Hyphomicrobiaceae bacterium]|nr:MFS transporter [Hyphomicrobiaceae bacterium]
MSKTVIEDGPPAKAASPPARAAVSLIVMLTLTTLLSQFYRSSSTVIAPELIRDLRLTPEMLGFANACFFLALLAVQIPVGLLFDRIGARLTVVGLSVAAVGGALLHAWVESGAGLAMARFLLGIGHGASFMATIFLISRWWPRERWSQTISWVFASSMLGVMLAGTPLAIASEWIGWRGAFLVMSLLSLTTGILFVIAVSDDPPGRAVPLRQHERFSTALYGFIEVMQLPGLWRILGLQFVAYAVMASIMGLWAGPYLNDVHGFTVRERGDTLIAMALAQTIGTLAFGPLDRLFNTRKWVAVAGALATIATLLALAASPRPPTWFAVALMVVLCAVSSYGVMVVTHARSLYPDHLAGRGTTTANIAQLIGCALIPLGTGFIPSLFPVTAAGYAPAAYQLIFAAIAGSLALGLVIYLTAKDVRPKS